MSVCGYCGCALNGESRCPNCSELVCRLEEVMGKVTEIRYIILRKKSDKKARKIEKKLQELLDYYKEGASPC